MAAVKTRDAEATKRRILDAAFKEFTANGFSGARVDEIADRAKVNKALIYQHYGDKEDLFKHVLRNKMTELARLTVDPERLPECAGELFDFHAKNQWFARLLQWEALNFGSRPVPDETARCERIEARVAEMEELQRRGALDPELDPRQTLFTLMGLVMFWFTAPQTARMVTGANPYTPEALAERRAHVVEMTRRMLEVR